jgi:hypothetical protein
LLGFYTEVQKMFVVTKKWSVLGFYTEVQNIAVMKKWTVI